MNTKSILFIAAIAASTSTFAAGRDSVYAQPGQSVGKSTKVTVTAQGRSSVYAKDLPAPRRSTGYAQSTMTKPGRA